MELTSADRVRDALCDLDYPASKQQIVDHAEGKGAAADVVRALRSLPLGDYGNEQEVVRSVPTV